MEIQNAGIMKKCLTENNYQHLIKADHKCQVDNMIMLYEQKGRRKDIISVGKKLSTKFRGHLKKRVKAWLDAMENIPIEKGEAWWMSWHRKWKASMLKSQMTRAEFIVTHIVDVESEELLISNLLRPYYENAGERGSARAVEILQGKIGRKIVFKGTQAWIGDNAIVFGKKYSRLITSTNNLAIRNKIATAITDGKSLDWTIKAIRSRVLGSNNLYRAEMISRTEMARAYNMSSLLQDSAMGIKKFEWFGCDEDCPICAEWLAGSPYDSAEEVEYIIMNTHPNCTGSYLPLIPEGFVPNRDTVDFLPSQTIRPEVYAT